MSRPMLWLLSRQVMSNMPRKARIKPDVQTSCPDMSATEAPNHQAGSVDPVGGTHKSVAELVSMDSSLDQGNDLYESSRSPKQERLLIAEAKRDNQLREEIADATWVFLVSREGGLGSDF